MRDEQNLLVDCVLRITLNGVQQNAPGRNRHVRTFRDDPVPTQRFPDGSYGYPTNYSAAFLRTSGQGGSAEYKWYTGAFNYRADWVSSGDNNLHNYGLDVYNLPAIPQSVWSRAHSRVLDAIRSNNLNLAQSLAEVRESVKTLYSVCRVAFGLLRFLRSLTPRELTSRWLEYQYGIRPLMNDAYALVEVISSGLDLPVANIRIKQNDDSFELPKPSGRFFYSGTVRRGVEIGYSVRVTNPTAFKAWQLGLTDPLSLAWELTTLSFVVDWFLHIGDFLGALVPPLGLTVDSGYGTAWLENSFHVHEYMWPVEDPRYIVTKPGYMDCTVLAKAMKRTTRSSLGIPLPYIDLGLTNLQVANLIALLAQRA